jgi:chromosome segregation ATPase
MEGAAPERREGRSGLPQELDALRDHLARVRAEAEEAESVSVTLKQQLEEIEGRVHLTRRAISDYEQAIAEKEQLLAAAAREEAIQRQAEAGARLAESVDRLLTDLAAYEEAEADVTQSEGRAADSLPPQPEVLRERWDRLKDAVRERSDVEFADELVEAAARSRVPSVIDSLPAHLREAARARVQARRREPAS